MKHNKILGLLGIAAALTLVACGGGKTSGSKKPGGNTAKTSKSSKPSTSKVPTKEVSAGTATVAKATDNKVYFTVTGSYDLYQAGELKFAWGLSEDGETFAYGAAAPEAAAYKADGVTLDATKKTFEAKLCVTDLSITSGNYKLYCGTSEDTGMAYGQVEVDLTFESMNDGKYRFYPRNDNSLQAVAIEVMPPIDFAEATVVKQAVGDVLPEDVYLKVGGDANATVTEEAIAAWNPYLDFEPVPYASPVRLTYNTDYAFTLAGGKFYAYFKISGLSAGTNYLTHFNHNGAKTNFFTSGAIADTPYTFDGVTYTIYSNPAAGQQGGEAEFYGCLAVKVTAVETPEVQ